MEYHVDAARPAVDDEESGRGPLLVKLLSTRWGCCPREGGFGKITWLECGPGTGSGELR